jgi:FAD:protein FMN transferase
MRRPAAVLFNSFNFFTHLTPVESLTLARNAMNTRFELVLHGGSPASLQAAAEEALNEVERIEAQLSLFRPSSEIARVNALAAIEPVRVSPEVFTLLNLARQLTLETGGAFDITMAPLLRCWGLLGRTDGQIPTDAELADARAKCGMGLVDLNAAHRTVRFAREGVMLDLGAIGKGYAVEEAADILQDAGVSSALIHGGTSTVFALGTPPEAEAWKIAVDLPPTTVAAPRQSAANLSADGGALPRRRYEVSLRDESLSVSAVAGKCFTAHGRTLGHIIDPRTGQPAGTTLLTAVALPSGAETDALSTALLVLGAEALPSFAARRPGIRALVAGADRADVAGIGFGLPDSSATEEQAKA